MYCRSTYYKVTNIPIYALTWKSLMFKDELKMGRSCDSISFPSESRIINSFEETCSNFALNQTIKTLNSKRYLGNT